MTFCDVLLMEGLSLFFFYWSYDVDRHQRYPEEPKIYNFTSSLRGNGMCWRKDFVEHRVKGMEKRTNVFLFLFLFLRGFSLVVNLRPKGNTLKVLYKRRM